MRRLVALIALRLARPDIGRGTGAVRRNERPKMIRVALGCEAGERNLDEIGIAEPRRAIGIGELFGFRHFVQGGGRVEAVLAQRKTFENIQDLDDMGPAGRGRRH